MAAIRDGKTRVDVKTGHRGLARVRGGPGTARMAIDLLRGAFNWAVTERMVPTNPCAGVKTGSSNVRDTILEDAASYGRLFKTLDVMEQRLQIRPQAALST